MNTKTKKSLFFGVCLSALALAVCAFFSLAGTAKADRAVAGGVIRWVDYTVTAEAMRDALAVDLATYATENHVSWIDLLSLLACKYGGNFSSYKKADLTALADRMKAGESAETLGAGRRLFSYYREAYRAVLSGYVGDFYRDGKACYGLRAFFPLAAGYSFEHYDDFGAARSYGFKREHLGHDLMGVVGTPVIAVESGYVEAIGWNQYGGWRIGIRSFDNKRYYYYAHLRKDRPYASLAEGDIVTAGDVIGYLGQTGYSVKENVNNIDLPHLHFGIQLIFEPSQKDGNAQIWIDCYEIAKFLAGNRMAVEKTEAGGDFTAKDPLVLPDLPD